MEGAAAEQLESEKGGGWVGTEPLHVVGWAQDLGPNWPCTPSRICALCQTGMSRVGAVAALRTKCLEEKWVCHEKRLLIASWWTKKGARTSGKGRGWAEGHCSLRGQLGICQQGDH